MHKNKINWIVSIAFQPRFLLLRAVRGEIVERSASMDDAANNRALMKNIVYRINTPSFQNAQKTRSTNWNFAATFRAFQPDGVILFQIFSPLQIGIPFDIIESGPAADPQQRTNWQTAWAEPLITFIQGNATKPYGESRLVAFCCTGVCTSAFRHTKLIQWR